MDVLSILFLVVIPQCICLADQHVVTLHMYNYICQLLLNLKKNEKNRRK